MQKVNTTSIEATHWYIAQGSGLQRARHSVKHACVPVSTSTSSTIAQHDSLNVKEWLDFSPSICSCTFSGHPLSCVGRRWLGNTWHLTKLHCGCQFLVETEQVALRVGAAADEARHRSLCVPLCGNATTGRQAARLALRDVQCQVHLQSSPRCVSQCPPQALNLRFRVQHHDTERRSNNRMPPHQASMDYIWATVLGIPARVISWTAVSCMKGSSVSLLYR